MNKIFRKELLIGVCVLCALAILFFGIDFLKGVNLFHASNYYYVTYDNVNGLAKSAPVTVNGYKVGQVRDITYLYDNPGHIQVELSLDSELKLPEGTQAALTTDMLGTSTISLELAAGNTYYPVGTQLPAKQPKGLMDGITQDLLPSVGKIVPKVDTLLTTINTLMSDPALAASIQRLDGITANLEATSVSLKRTTTLLPPIATDVKGITGNFVTTSDNLAQFSDKLNRMPVDSLMQQLAVTTDNLRKLTEQLNDPNSTLGLMMNDPKLYNNLNSTVQSLDSLFIDIKANPKRYINIKLL